MLDRLDYAVITDYTVFTASTEGHKERYKGEWSHGRVGKQGRYQDDRGPRQGRSYVLDIQSGGTRFA